MKSRMLLMSSILGVLILAAGCDSQSPHSSPAVATRLVPSQAPLSASQEPKKASSDSEALILSGNNTYTGATTVVGGMLSGSGTLALGGSSHLQTANGAINGALRGDDGNPSQDPVQRKIVKERVAGPSCY